MTHHYLNLTNGLEHAADFPSANWHVLRIRSTVIEHRNWPQLFADLDHDLLFRLSQGERCIVYDCGCRRAMSKTVSVGVPLIRDVLSVVWLGFAVHSGDSYSNHFAVQRILERPESELALEAKRKLTYYRRWLRTDEVRLEGVSRATTHDGDRAFYRWLLEGVQPVT